jgi:hypothetical protein
MVQPPSNTQGAVCISGTGNTPRSPCAAGGRRTRHKAGGRAALPGRRLRARLAAQAGLPLELAAEEGRGSVAAARGRAARRQRAPHEDVAALAAPAAGRPAARSARPCSGRRPSRHQASNLSASECCNNPYESQLSLACRSVGYPTYTALHWCYARALAPMRKLAQSLVVPETGRAPAQLAAGVVCAHVQRHVAHGVTCAVGRMLAHPSTQA